MRILLVNDFVKPIGGAEIFVHKLKENLEKRNHRVKLFGSLGKEDLNSFFSRWYGRKWAKELEKEIKEFKPDAIHVNNFARILSP